MTKLKTKPNDASVIDFINQVSPEWKRQDSLRILKLMEEVTCEKPKMWGDSIIGFGNYHYRYESGREGDWFLAGFSPRKLSFTIYMMGGYIEQETFFANLGKSKKSKGCLYFNKLADIDIEVLRTMITNSIQTLRKKYG